MSACVVVFDISTVAKYECVSNSQQVNSLTGQSRLEALVDRSTWYLHRLSIARLSIVVVG